MSIQRDVEKMYRDDQDKKRRKQKKKKKSFLTTVVVIVVIILALLLLMKLLDLDFGLGKGNAGEGPGQSQAGEADRAVTVESEAQETETVTEPAVPKEYVGVKVSGSVYIYNDQVYELEVLRESISKMKDNVVILITDDNSTQNAMEALTTTLAGDGREYIIESNITEESSPDSSETSFTVTTLIP